MNDKNGYAHFYFPDGQRCIHVGFFSSVGFNNIFKSYNKYYINVYSNFNRSFIHFFAVLGLTPSVGYHVAAATQVCGPHQGPRRVTSLKINVRIILRRILTRVRPLPRQNNLILHSD